MTPDSIRTIAIRVATEHGWHTAIDGWQLVRLHRGDDRDLAILVWIEGAEAGRVHPYIDARRRSACEEAIARGPALLALCDAIEKALKDHENYDDPPVIGGSASRGRVRS